MPDHDLKQMSYYEDEDVFSSASKYHRPSCEMIGKINRNNLRRLRSWKIAVELGFTPCGICKPFAEGAQAATIERQADQMPGELDAERQAKIEANERRMAEIEKQLAEERQTPDPPGAKQVRLVTIAELTDWRRRIVQALSRLDQTGQRPLNESVGGQISRLSHQGVIPRMIAPMLRTITEMRNSVEYESKTLSEVESLAAWGNWLAIRDWAEREGLQI